MNIIQQTYYGDYTPGAIAQSILDKYYFVPILKDRRNSYFEKRGINSNRANQHSPIYETPLSKSARELLNKVFYTSASAILISDQLSDNDFWIMLVVLTALGSLGGVIYCIRHDLQNCRCIEARWDALVPELESQTKERSALNIKKQTILTKQTTQKSKKFISVVLRPKRVFVKPFKR